MKSKTTNSTFVLLAATSICVGPITAVSASEAETGIWAVFSTSDFMPSDRPTPRWQYAFDAQARYVDFGSGANQWLLRPAVGYRFANGVNAWVGYARVESRSASGRRVSENRYWQQLDWRAGEIADGHLTMRLRVEERSVDSGNDLGLVARFMTKFVRPFSDDPTLSFVFAIEPFVDLKNTDWGGKSGLGQNRTSIGIGWKLNQTLTLEASYMNQYIWTDQGPDRVNHLAVFNFKTKF